MKPLQFKSEYRSYRNHGFNWVRSIFRAYQNVKVVERFNKSKKKH